MKIKKIYEYKLTSTYGKIPIFEMKCIEFKVSGKREQHGNDWYYGIGDNDTDKNICEDISLDSNLVIGDGAVYYSELKDNETEIMNFILEKVEKELEAGIKSASEWESHRKKKIEYIKNTINFEKQFTKSEGILFGGTGRGKTFELVFKGAAVNEK